MKWTPEELEQLIAEEGVSALGDPEVLAEIERNPEVHGALQQLTTALGAVDRGLAEMPAHDVDDQVIETLFSHPELSALTPSSANTAEDAAIDEPAYDEPAEDEPAREDSNRGNVVHLAPASWSRRHGRELLLAAVLVMTIGLVLAPKVLRQQQVDGMASQAPPDRENTERAETILSDRSRHVQLKEKSAELAEQLESLGYLGDDGGDRRVPVPDPTPDLARDDLAPSEPEAVFGDALQGLQQAPPPAAAKPKPPAPPPPPAKPAPTHDLIAEWRPISGAREEAASGEVRTKSEVPRRDFNDSIDVVGETPEIAVSRTMASSTVQVKDKDATEFEWDASSATLTFDGTWPPIPDRETVTDDSSPGRRQRVQKLEAKSADDESVDIDSQPSSSAGSIEEVIVADARYSRHRQQAQQLLERWQTLAIATQPATGYWANSYIPGDPEMRLLHAELSGELGSAASTIDLPHDLARPPAQPFDAPEDTAIALQLQSTPASISSPSRVLVQIGLRATERFGGRRPAMRVALILDLRQVPSAADAASMRAVVEAFARARDLGDQFHLLVAGPGGGELVSADEFRYGPLRLALEDVLSDQPRKGVRDNAADVGLAEITDQARALVAGANQGPDPAINDPAIDNTPLGSSAIVMITTGLAMSGDDDPERRRLERSIHRAVTASVPVSVFGIGSQVDARTLQQLVITGHGHRRLISNPDDAKDAAERELAAASRAVARALRLRLRLAPGVHLVDVIGSHRLDQDDTQRVRESEQAVDRALAKQIGIAADRGDDEDGLQIVIPAFYAGDHHVILLDTLVAGAGPVADVTVRYKDLVSLDNSIVRDQISLGDGTSSHGPLERNVLLNRLAFELRDGLYEASRQLEQGDLEAARSGLTSLRDAIVGLPLERPELKGDTDLERYQRLLESYLHKLDGQGVPLAALGNSMTYAGWRLIQDPPR